MDQKTASPQRFLEVLEALLRLPAADLATTLNHVANLVAEATGADKIDAFIYDPTRDSLVAVGTSTQPLSARQRQLGLDVLPVSNGGRVVHVFKTGETFMTGQLERDMTELPGVREALKIRSKLGVPLDIGALRRGGRSLDRNRRASRRARGGDRAQRRRARPPRRGRAARYRARA